MQFAAGGEWFDRVQRYGSYQEPGAAACLARLANALNHVHTNGLIHRDVKLQNILLESRQDPNSVLLSDFDMACLDSAPSPEKYGLFGTEGYTAPELGGSDYSYKVDVWSLGVCLFMVLSGKHPQFSPGGAAPASGAARVEFPDLEWQDKSDDVKGLIQAMLEPNPSQRLSTKQVALSQAPQEWLTAELQVLEHPWLNIADSSDVNQDGSVIMANGAENTIRRTRTIA